MKTADFLREHDACREGAAWALSVSKDMADVWDAMIEQKKHDWLLWTITRSCVFPSAALRKLACQFVRETPLVDGRVVLDLLTDERSRKAIEVAERYADGKATTDELAAANAAAYAAARAARAAVDAAEAAYEVYDVYVAAIAAARAAYDVYDDYAAARAAAYAAEAAAWSARAAVDARVAEAYDSAEAAAYAAQIKMVIALGNPFKKGADK